MWLSVKKIGRATAPARNAAPAVGGKPALAGHLAAHKAAWRASACSILLLGGLGGPSCIAGLGAGAALAQQADGLLGSDIPFNPVRADGVSVARRGHPELDPVGLRQGSMIFFPTLRTGAGYTNNVFGSSPKGEGGSFVVMAPSVSGVSQWSRHSLQVDASAGLKRFVEQSTRNETAYSLQASGRLDLGTDGDNLVGLYHHMRGFETQYSGAFPNNAAGTVGYYQNEALLRGTFGINRFKLIASAKVNDLDYSDTVSRTGAVINQQFRDRIEYIPAVRIEYEFPADAKVFGELSYSVIDYRFATASQPLRSNHTTRALVGVNFKLTPLVRVIVGGGFEQRAYEVASYGTIKGLVADVRVEWLATELTTVNLQVARRVDDAIFINSPGFFTSSARLHVDHELLRSVILFAEAGYERNSFVGVDRRDRQVQLLGGATYSLNRLVKIQPSLRYIKRESSGTLPGLSFEELRGEIDLVISL